ncbi:MAG: phosphatase PAP2 family protein [Candidatus Hydrogenedentes bacterium]|nr:phosphatase PAP2 family protein [Candidatus Hydrogenedentota bacterium]
MRAYLKSHRPYFGLFTVWALLAGLIIATTEQPDLHLTFNNVNVAGWDSFFVYANYLGEGYFAYGLAIALCFVRFRWGASVFLACLIAGLTSQLLKQQVFGPVPRPAAFFGEPTPLYLVPGVDLHSFYSFPSGHSAIAFALATALMLLTPWRTLRAVLFFLALLGAYSRVYLSQHFFEDIYAGSFVGLIAALIAHRLVVVRRPKVVVPETTEKAGAAPVL